MHGIIELSRGYLKKGYLKVFELFGTIIPTISSKTGHDSQENPKEIIISDWVFRVFSWLLIVSVLRC